LKAKKARGAFSGGITFLPDNTHLVLGKKFSVIYHLPFKGENLGSGWCLFRALVVFFIGIWQLCGEPSSLCAPSQTSLFRKGISKRNIFS
jgi:hypothetical protein